MESGLKHEACVVCHAFSFSKLAEYGCPWKGSVGTEGTWVVPDGLCRRELIKEREMPDAVRRDGDGV